MTAVPVLADRVMKARRESVCPVCRCVVRVGEYIARCGGVWMHRQCLLDHRSQHHDAVRPSQPGNRDGRQHPERRSTESAYQRTGEGSGEVTHGME